MSKPTLLVVKPDEHYMDHVAKPAQKAGYIGRVVTVDLDADAFAAAIGRLDRSNLIIAKGMPETADFLRMLMKYNNRELVKGGTGGFLSHSVVLWKKASCLGRLLGKKSGSFVMTDGAVNIAPDAAAKIKITKNSIDFVRAAFGISRPIVSILTPSGKPNPLIKASNDGMAVIEALADEDAIIRLDQLDTAIDADARRIKKLDGDIADIIVVDNLDVGNMIWKLHTMRAGYEASGLVSGAVVPITLNSRADSALSKLHAIKHASKVLQNQ